MMRLESKSRKGWLDMDRIYRTALQVGVGLTLLSSVSLADTSKQTTIRESYSAAEAYQGARAVMESREHLPELFNYTASVTRDLLVRARQALNEAYSTSQSVVKGVKRQCVRQKLDRMLNDHLALQLKELVRNSLVATGDVALALQFANSTIDSSQLDFGKTATQRRDFLHVDHVVHFYLDENTVCQAKVQWPLFETNEIRSCNGAGCIEKLRPDLNSNYFILLDEDGNLREQLAIESIFSPGECIDLRSMKQRFPLMASGRSRLWTVSALKLDEVDQALVGESCKADELDFATVALSMRPAVQLTTAKKYIFRNEELESLDFLLIGPKKPLIIKDY